MTIVFLTFRENYIKMNTKKDNDFYGEVFVEFIEVLIHQILYIRDVYPRSIFEPRKKFGLPLQMSQHPWVNSYIASTLGSLKSLLLGSVQISIHTCKRLATLRSNSTS